MLSHRGILRHFKVWDDAPTANRFLGAEDVEAYKKLSLIERCAQRVVASWREIDRLRAWQPDLVHVIDYNKLLVQRFVESTRLAEFLGVESAFRFPESVAAQSVKWRDALTAEQVDCILSYVASVGGVEMLEQR